MSIGNIKAAVEAAGGNWAEFVNEHDSELSYLLLGVDTGASTEMADFVPGLTFQDVQNAVTAVEQEAAAPASAPSQYDLNNDVNNLDLSASSKWWITSDSNSNDINGIQAGQDGEMKTLANNGGNGRRFRLRANRYSSPVGTRISKTVIVRDGTAITLIYSTDIGKWIPTLTGNSNDD